MFWTTKHVPQTQQRFSYKVWNYQLKIIIDLKVYGSMLINVIVVTSFDNILCIIFLINLLLVDQLI